MASNRELMAAYAGTHFEANTPAGLLVLRVGQRNDLLVALYARGGVSNAAYITAWNPMSVPQTPEQNEAAHARLIESLRAGGFPFYDGDGRDPTGLWPPEKSVLILGITEAAACDLGRRFGQAAVVVAGADAVPRLVCVGESQRHE